MGTELQVTDDDVEAQRLSRALGEKTEFSVEEWLAFGVFDLRLGHFIQSGNNFFAPAEAADRDRPETWMDGFRTFQVRDENGDDEETETYSVHDYYQSWQIGWNGREVKYVGIMLEAKEITPWARPGEDVMMKQYKKFDDLRHNLNHIAYEACGSEVFMTDLSDKFVFMNNQAIYRTSSIRGALIGVVIAFAVLLVCTWSPFLAFFATLSILCAMMSGNLFPSVSRVWLSSVGSLDTLALDVLGFLPVTSQYSLPDSMLLLLTLGACSYCCSNRTPHHGGLGARQRRRDPHLDLGWLFSRLRGASCARVLAQLWLLG